MNLSSTKQVYFYLSKMLKGEKRVPFKLSQKSQNNFIVTGKNGIKKKSTHLNFLGLKRDIGLSMKNLDKIPLEFKSNLIPGSYMGGGKIFFMHNIGPIKTVFKDVQVLIISFLW